MEHEKHEVSVVPLGKSAQRLASTTRVVKGLVKTGVLIGVRLPGRKRYSGITSDSLERLIEQSSTAQMQEG